MQIDLTALSIIVSILVGLCTIFTFIRTNAKNQAEAVTKQEETNGKIDLLQNEMGHIKTDVSELKDEVHKYNQLKDRMYAVESEVKVQGQQIKVEQHRMDDVEQAVEKNRDKLINMTRR